MTTDTATDDGGGRRRRRSAAIEPLVVSPAQACQMLGIGNTKLYQLIAAGELETYTDGRARKITTASIRARIARKLAEAAA
jgi:excisionase family DNA binding protein